MSDSFESMLQAIRRGESVPLARLLRLCPDELSRRSLLELFHRRSDRVVGIRDEPAFDALAEHYGRPFDGANRMTAALSGRSHRVSVGGGLITLRSLVHPHPQVLCVDAEGRVAVPRPLAREAVIVENLENFLQFDQTLQFCRRRCGLLTEATDLEVVFGAGVQVNAARNHPVWRGFHRLWVLPDLDVGGLDICRQLLRGLAGEVPVTVLVPDDLAKRLRSQGRPLMVRESDRLRRVAQADDAVAGIARTLLAAGKKLEQETYLLDEDEG